MKNPAYQIFAFSAEVACSCWMHVERKDLEIRSPLPKLNHNRILLNFRVHSIISTTLETLLYTGFNERLARGFNLLIRTGTTAHMMQKMPKVKIKRDTTLFIIKLTLNVRYEPHFNYVNW